MRVLNRRADTKEKGGPRTIIAFPKYTLDNNSQGSERFRESFSHATSKRRRVEGIKTDCHSRAEFYNRFHHSPNLGRFY